VDDETLSRCCGRVDRAPPREFGRQAAEEVADEDDELEVDDDDPPFDVAEEEVDDVDDVDDESLEVADAEPAPDVLREDVLRESVR
jgi:hypothetical protein